MEPKHINLLVRFAIALLIILFVPFVIILLCPFEVLFDSTPTTTATFFASINTGSLLNDFVLIYAIKTVIELFGYQSILYGLSWYFIIAAGLFFGTWVVGGFITRNHKLNLAIWLLGLIYVFVITWIAATTVPSGNHPASEAFMALQTLMFSWDAWFPILLYALLCFGGAALGTAVGHHFGKSRPMPECTPRDYLRGKCEEPSLP